MAWFVVRDSSICNLPCQLAVELANPERFDSVTRGWRTLLVIGATTTRAPYQWRLGTPRRDRLLARLHESRIKGHGEALLILFRTVAKLPTSGLDIRSCRRRWRSKALEVGGNQTINAARRSLSTVRASVGPVGPP
jgi:hypothetical protein